MRKINEENELYVYNYNELSQEAKEFVKEDYLREQQDMSCYYSEYVSENLYERYKLNLDFNYSLSYCQGDGFCFHGDIDIEDFVNNNEAMLLEEFNKSDIEIIKALSDIYYQVEIRHFGRYYHYHALEFDFTNDLAYEYDNDEDFKEEYAFDFTLEKGLEVMRTFMTYMESFIEKLCKDYETSGYNYFYDVDEATLSDWASNYGFYEDGTIYA